MYKHVNKILQDELRIKIDVSRKSNSVKKACQFLFSSEDKNCIFDDDKFDIIVDGYPTRQSLAGNAKHMSLDSVDKYFDTYEHNFLSVVSTDDYEYLPGYSIWIPATLQKIEAAVTIGYSEINIYDINRDTLEFCSLVMLDDVDTAIKMIKKFGKNTSPISLSIEEKIELTIDTAKRLVNVSANVNFIHEDLMNFKPTAELVDISNIFVFPRNTWVYSDQQLKNKFNGFSNVIGWSPDFSFIK